jgi:hypothetical protein
LQWLSLNYTKTTLISRDSKPNTEEEEREKLITMPEKDLFPKKKENITLLNIDSLSELPAPELSVKSLMPPLTETEFYAKLTLPNSENTDLPLDLPIILLPTPPDSSSPEDC